MTASFAETKLLLFRKIQIYTAPTKASSAARSLYRTSRGCRLGSGFS